MYNSYMPDNRVVHPRVGEIILYRVNKGDNLYRLAKTFHSDENWIRMMNDLGEDEMIFPNQQLLIPYLFQPMKPQPYQRQNYDLYF